MNLERLNAGERQQLQILLGKIKVRFHALLQPRLLLTPSFTKSDTATPLQSQNQPGNAGVKRKQKDGNTDEDSQPLMQRRKHKTKAEPGFVDLTED
jgi:hypothetical protein